MVFGDRIPASPPGIDRCLSKQQDTKVLLYFPSSSGSLTHRSKAQCSLETPTICIPGCSQTLVGKELRMGRDSLKSGITGYGIGSPRWRRIALAAGRNDLL